MPRRLFRATFQNVKFKRVQLNTTKKQNGDLNDMLSESQEELSPYYVIHHDAVRFIFSFSFISPQSL